MDNKSGRSYWHPKNGEAREIVMIQEDTDSCSVNFYR